MHRSYEKRMKNRALKSAVQISATPHMYCNLKTSKMGKTWHFISCYRTNQNQLSCYRNNTKIKLKRKYSLTRAKKTKPKN
jgi:hypothetical protein